VGDILHALDTGNIALLTLLDYSAAFYSVYHGVLLQRLPKSYGLHVTVIGWGTLLVEVSTSALQHRNSPRHLSCTACHKGRSSGRSCLSCMLLTYCSWWKITGWWLTHTRMIPRFLVFVVRQSQKHFRAACPTAWMLLDRGWLQIGSLWTMTRQKHCGVHPYDGNIRSRRDLYVSEVHLYSQSPLSGILWSTCMQMLPCVLMWPQLSGRDSLHYAR